MFPWQANSFEISDKRTADTGLIYPEFDTLPTCHSLSKKILMYLSLLFAGPVWPAMSPVLRRSLVDFESCKGRESQRVSEWLMASLEVSPIKTKSTDNVKVLNHTQQSVQYINWTLVSKEHRILSVHMVDTDELLQLKIGAPVLCFLRNLCHHFAAIWIINSASYPIH